MADGSGRPRLESVYFGGPESPYARMARVLESTARRHCPGWILNVNGIAPEPVTAVDRLCANNSQKLDAWWRAIVDAPTGQRILLIDADTFFTNPIDDVWSHDFDIAYTVRIYDLPFNGGVVFVRVSAETKAFFDEWRRCNTLMLHDRRMHQEWRKRYGGINQASFGWLLNNVAPLPRMVTLPCSEWNCEESCWDQFDPAVTRIVHVKSGLRRTIFGPQSAARGPTCVDDPVVLTPLAARWCALEDEANERVRGVAL
jgi:hypothetical protein